MPKININIEKNKNNIIKKSVKVVKKAVKVEEPKFNIIKSHTKQLKKIDRAINSIFYDVPQDTKIKDVYDYVNEKIIKMQKDDYWKDTQINLALEFGDIGWRSQKFQSIDQILDFLLDYNEEISGDIMGFNINFFR